MTQEEKQLLLKDLSARLPYGVICDRLGKPKKLLGIYPTKKFSLEFDNGEYMPSDYMLEDIKPYLRPMSSMTEKEKKELEDICTMYNGSIGSDWESFGLEVLQTHPTYGDSFCQDFTAIDWLNSHHFDYRGLIERGLALEAKEGMYNI